MFRLYFDPYAPQNVLSTLTIWPFQCTTCMIYAFHHEPIFRQ